MKRIKIALFVSLAFATLTSCIHINKISYEQNAREPKPDNYPIEILQSDKIQKEYKVIGEVSANGPNNRTEKILEKLRIETRQMGGDALIDFESGTLGEGVMTNGIGVYDEDAKQTMKAKVIVWEEE